MPVQQLYPCILIGDVIVLQSLQGSMMSAHTLVIAPSCNRM